MRIAEDESGPLYITASPGFIGRLSANRKYPGYRVETVLVDVPADEAWRRMIGRGHATGQFIPPDIMAAEIDGAPRTYQTLKESNRADAYARIENTPGLGEPRGILENPHDILAALGRRDGGDRPAPGGPVSGTPEGAAGGPDQAGITKPHIYRPARRRG